MPTYRVMTSLQDVSNMARDRYVNTWYFATNELPTLQSTFATLADAQRDAYDGIRGTLSSGIGIAGHTTKIYTVGAPKDTPPIYDRNWSFTAAPGSPSFNNLPGEVAVCLTMHADPQPGIHRQSWRGRVYIGPFNASALDSTVGAGSGRPDASFRQALLSTGEFWDTACNAAGGRWVIYSKKLNRVYPVANCSVDDAFDTQRRRGLRPTTSVKSPPLHGAGVPSGPA